MQCSLKSETHGNRRPPELPPYEVESVDAATSGSSRGRSLQIAVRQSEQCPSRNAYTLKQNYHADDDHPEQQSVLGKSLPRRVIPKLLGERRHMVLSSRACRSSGSVYRGGRDLVPDA